jgi:monoamine oxidase
MYPRAGRLIGEPDGRPIPGVDARRLSSHHVNQVMVRAEPWASQFAWAGSLATLLGTCLIEPSWYRIRGGMDELPRRFVRELGEGVTYGAAVGGLTSDDDGITATYRVGGDERSVRADFAVCAVPYTTLRSIRVSPPLPEDARRVMHDCPYESAVRVFVQLADRTSFAPDWSGYGVTADGLEIWQPTSARRQPRALLVLYGQADAARALVALDPSRRIAAALDRRDALFPGVRSRCERTARICWDEEPWSLGAQSLIDTLPAARRIAARPHGRIHFAGEHTTSGWMDGALASGHRAASAVNRLPSD